VEQQGLIVFHQEMVELQIGPLSKDGDAIDIRRDFRGDRRAAPSIGFLNDVSSPQAIFPNGAHAASADGGEDFVRAESCACG
jgi:hypothetical protein